MSFTESSPLHAKTRDSSPISTPIPCGKKVMAFGTFDLFHPGHVYYLTEAEMLGDRLIVVIARDARVREIKKLIPHDEEMIRKRNVAHAFRDALVILGDEHDIFAPLYEHTPDILAFGYDQRVPEEKIHELFPAVEIVRVGGYDTHKWKSSILRNDKQKHP